jgi:RNA polymerase sigma-70 factor (ECF subfamily)
MRWRRGLAAERLGALQELYKRYRTKVYSTALHVTGDPSGAEDVTQDTFVRVYEKFDTFECRSSLSSWLYSIAVNFATERRRRDQRAPVRLPNVVDESEDEGDVGVVDVADKKWLSQDEQLDSSERNAAVQMALARLSHKLRVVAVLRYTSDLSYEEIAEVLRCSVGTVKSRLNRAHEALSKILSPRIGSVGERPIREA